MLSILLVIFSCVCYAVTAQTATNIVSITPVSSVPKSNWEDFTSHQGSQETIKTKRDKLSCVLKLMKNALAEELQNSYYLTDKTAQDNVSSINKNIEQRQSLENNENQLEKPILRDENEADVINTHQSVDTETKSEFSNHTNEQSNIQLPNMIPIFKPRPQPSSELNQNVNDFGLTSMRLVPRSKVVSVPENIIQTVANPISSQPLLNQNMVSFSASPITTNPIKTSRAVSFLPEKIVQTNMSPATNQARLNIPCQRAADVLDMNIMVPKQAVCRNTNVNTIANTTKPIYSSQLPAPVECADEDDIVAMLFKPKNISLKQVYGNLLKKITITVLVPYHMSKLGRKPNS